MNLGLRCRLGLSLVAFALGDAILVGLLDREEHGPELGEPLAVDGCRALHVLLGCHDKLVVDDLRGRPRVA